MSIVDIFIVEDMGLPFGGPSNHLPSYPICHHVPFCTTNSGLLSKVFWQSLNAIFKSHSRKALLGNIPLNFCCKNHLASDVAQWIFEKSLYMRCSFWQSSYGAIFYGHYILMGFFIGLDTSFKNICQPENKKAATKFNPMSIFDIKVVWLLWQTAFLKNHILFLFNCLVIEWKCFLTTIVQLHHKTVWQYFVWFICWES